MRRSAVAFAAAAVLLSLATAPARSEDSLADRAEAAFAAEEWGSAESLFAQLGGEDSSGYPPFRRAVALLHLGRVPEARASLDLAEEKGYTPAAVAFRRACADALEGQRESAVEQLVLAAERGLSSLAILENEPMLASVVADSGFGAVREAIDRIARPCRHDPRYRAFDFWIGTWDVRPAGAPDAGPASENVITLEYEGCVIMEHWTSIGGGTGSSFNIFDASRGIWVQTWVDSGGGLHEYRGNPDAEGNMIFGEGETPGGPGEPARVPTRLSFFRLGPDRVRQFSESSLDGGTTWTPNYDLIYTRRRVTATE